MVGLFPYIQAMCVPSCLSFVFRLRESLEQYSGAKVSSSPLSTSTLCPSKQPRPRALRKSPSPARTHGGWSLSPRPRFSVVYSDHVIYMTVFIISLSLPLSLYPSLPLSLSPSLPLSLSLPLPLSLPLSLQPWVRRHMCELQSLNKLTNPSYRDSYLCACVCVCITSAIL